MRESDLYAPIVGGLIDEGFLAFKIIDGSAGKKPFDISGADMTTGIALALEIKAPSRHREAIGVDWTLFDTHQRAWLRSYARIGAIALPAIYNRSSRLLDVWIMRSGKDLCDREPDLSLSRNPYGNFTGWANVRKKEKALCQTQE